jgi:putative protein-disulfide isomerase
MQGEVKLHYIYDPFCGWCYGLAPLITAADEMDGIKVVPHSGGMLAGERAQMMSADWRDFVRPHEERIKALSGQQFGENYTSKTQFDYGVLLDSGPPTAAMIAAEEVAGAGVAMLKRLQVAWYVDGREITKREEIIRNAEELGLDIVKFGEAFDRASAGLDGHFAATQALLEKLGGQGYPLLAIEKEDGLHKLHLGFLFGKPEAFKAALQRELVPKEHKQ